MPQHSVPGLGIQAGFQHGALDPKAVPGTDAGRRRTVRPYRFCSRSVAVPRTSAERCPSAYDHDCVRPGRKLARPLRHRVGASASAVVADIEHDRIPLVHHADLSPALRAWARRVFRLPFGHQGMA